MTNVSIDTFHSKYIRKLDVKDKASVLIVLNKLQSGLLLMSSTYCRFFQCIMPMISMIDDYKDKNEDLCDFSRKKFASILRTYLRTDELAAEEQPMLYTLKTEMYDINLDPAAKQIESHVVVTLKDIDNSLFILMKDILAMAEDPDIEKWKENGRYEKISQRLNILTKDILYAQEDFAKAFLDTDSNAKINNLIKNRRASQKILNNNLDSMSTLISAVGSNVTLLCELYECICNTVYTISTGIDLANPLHIEESDRSVEELYNDYYKMNDEAIKRDTYRNGLDLLSVIRVKRRESLHSSHSLILDAIQMRRILKKMKLWIDDVRPAPDGYIWCKSVNETIAIIENNSDISLIDIDHDAGDYYSDGGDYIRILDWLEENGYSYPIHIHSMNSVGVQNMRSIIRHNCWTEIK